MQTVKSKQAFQLILRQRELEAVYHLLDQVNHLETAQKRDWIDHNGGLVMDAFNSFLHLSRTDFAVFNANHEAGQISSQILQLLDQTTKMMKSLFNQPGDLIS